VIARTSERASWAREVRPWKPGAAQGILARCDLLVDATSVGLDPTRDAAAEHWPLDSLPAQAAVATLIYHREPSLVAEARRRGHRTFGGAGMLVHQGARAFRIWTGLEPPVDAMWAAMRHHPGV
jgi:shikimate dehydrogenase